MTNTHNSTHFRPVKTPSLLQMEATECGAASLGIILAYHGRFIPLDRLRDECQISRDGSSAALVKKTAENHGLSVKAYQVTIPQLQAMQPPFIAFWERKHFLVIEGFTRDKVSLNDPASGRYAVSLADFETSFSGIVFQFEPTPEFRKGGRKPNSWHSIARRMTGTSTAITFTVLAGIAWMITELITATFSPFFVDQVLVAQHHPWIRPLVSVMALTLLFRLAVGFTQSNVLIRLKQALAASHSSRFVWHVLRLPITFYQQRYAGDVANRVDANSTVADLVSGPLATTLVSLLMIGVYGTVMFSFDPLLATVGVIVGLLNITAIAWVQRTLADESIKVKHYSGILAGSMMHALQIIETLKASASEQEALVRLTGNQARLSNASQRITVITGLLVLLPPLLSLITTALVLAIGGRHVIQGLMSVGSLVAFQTLFNQFNQPFTAVVSLGSNIQTLQADLARLDDVEQNAIDPAFHHTHVSPNSTEYSSSLTQLSGSLEFQDVTFSFNRTLAAPLIKHLSLSIKPGTRVALVGPSGSGKSTIGRLAAGLLRPSVGTILYDEFTIDQIPRELFTAQVGLVDDQSLLFSGSIRENLTLWDDTIPDRLIIPAAHDAAIHHDISRLRNGYSAKLSEGARNLSGGQRQRIEIARTLLHSPTLLILDEATSALDAITESMIDDNIRRRHCTCLIIAHRLSTIRDADEIIVLRHGEITERGTHDDLMSRADGFYAQLHSLQDTSTSLSLTIPHNPLSSTLPSRNGHTTDESTTADNCAASEPKPTQRAITMPQPEPLSIDLRSTYPSAIARRKQRDQALILTSLAKLSLPKSTEHQHHNAAPLTTALTTPTDALISACRTVGFTQGINVKSPSLEGVDNPLRLIARASNFRARRIKLAPDWWNREGPPMLGYLHNTGQPIALVPDKTNRYLLIDPTTGTRSSINPQLAAQLQPSAVLFYPTLRPDQTTLRAFATFALPAIHRELRTILVAGSLCALLGLILPKAIAVAIDEVIPQADQSQLNILCAFLAAVALAVAAMQSIQILALSRFRTKLESTLLPAIWDRLLNLPTRFFSPYDAGDLAVRALGPARLIETLSTTTVASMLLSIFALSNILALIIINWRLGLVAAGLMLAIPLGTALLLRPIWRHHQHISNLRGEIAGLLFLLLGGISRLRVAGAEPRAFARWAARYEQQLHSSVKLQSLTARLTLFDDACALGILILIFAVAILGPASLTLGEFLAFNASLSAALVAVVNLSNGTITLLQGLRECIRFAPILSTPPEAADTTVESVQLAGAIELHNVSFRYTPDGPLVLNNVNISINPGEFVAIVGPTGSGKSTILRLLLGFESPTQGSVSYDGRELTTLDLHEVRRQTGVVLQDARLRPGDIYSNIVGLSTELTREDAWQAAELAGLANDLREMPMGIHTVVTEGGSGLSTGQRQRLVIARALVGKPRILLFDEATSALDNQTQELVSQSIHTQLQGTTRLAIAHRLSTIQNADRIYVLVDGQIVQAGPYTHLLTTPGPFQNLARRQLLNH